MLSSVTPLRPSLVMSDTDTMASASDATYGFADATENTSVTTPIN